MSVILLLVILVFGEVLPKVFFRTYAESATLAMSWFVVLTVRFFAPVAVAFNWVCVGILRIFGQKVEGQRGFVNKQTIMSLLDAGESEGTIHASEKEMINSIFHFSDKLVKEIMVPRVDMIAWNSEDDVDKLVTMITRDGFSRVPVYEGSIDNIIGLINAKDLFSLVSRGDLSREDVMEAMRKPFFVPDTKRIDELLRQFQRDKVHLAMVIDEYSGIAGLVTIEDIIEEIVGEIEDEFDPEVDTNHYTELGEGLFRVDPRMALDEFSRLVGTDIEDEDVETVGGLVYSLFGKIPRQGESILMEGSGISFTVQRVRKNRIFEVLVRTARAASGGG
jgi:putative hemolysin